MIVAGSCLIISILLLIHNFYWVFFWENIGMTIGLIAGYFEINKELKSGKKIELIP